MFRQFLSELDAVINTFRCILFEHMNSRMDNLMIFNSADMHIQSVNLQIKILGTVLRDDAQCIIHKSCDCFNLFIAKYDPCSSLDRVCF